MFFQQTLNRGIILTGGSFRFNFSVISAVTRWWSLATCAPLTINQFGSCLVHLRSTKSACGWFLCKKGSITKLLVLQNYTSLSPLLSITPHPCLLISLSYLLFSEPPLAFMPPITRSRSGPLQFVGNCSAPFRHHERRSWELNTGLQISWYVFQKISGPYYFTTDWFPFK